MDNASRNEQAVSAASLFEPGRNCTRVARAERVALLIDAERYFTAFAQAAQLARHSIMILAWDFDSRTRLHWNEGDSALPNTLGEFLNFLVKRRRGLNVYILNWDYPMVFGTDREFPPLYGLGWKPRRRVHLRYDNTHPVGGSHHQKIVVIDDAIAFTGGLDLTTRRWDTCLHRAEDPRRMVDGTAYPPFHDLMIATDGEAARALGDISRERWLRATGERVDPPPAHNDTWPSELEPQVRGTDVAISRTVPKTEVHEQVREVEALYLDMIARAKRYIYIENQYFTADKIGQALAARLAEPDGPEVVIVLRLLSHGWLEEHTMHVLRTRLINALRAADRQQKLGIYFPHVPGLKDGTCVDVHSKAIVVDDEWLRIGSANVSNRSMGYDTECDVTVEARGDPRVAVPIREFLDSLLSEHLGVEASHVRSEIDRLGSLNGAIRALHSNARTLQPLDELPQWSDAVLTAAAVADPEQPVEMDKLITEFSPDTSARKSGFPWIKFAIAACVVAALTAAWRYTPLAELITAEKIIEWARTFGGSPWGPVVVLLAYTPASLIMFPRPLITLFAIVAFGPWLGFGYALAGILLAALATYAAGRMMRRDTVRRITGSRLNRVTDVLRRRGLVAMSAVRLVPVAPFAVVGVVAGAIRIKLWHYALGSLIGMLPGTLAATIFGDQLETALRDPSQINYWVVGGVVVAFAAGIFFVRRWFTRQMQSAPRAKAVPA